MKNHKNLKSLINNILNGDMDGAKNDIHIHSSRLMQRKLNEDWDTGETEQCIMKDESLYSNALRARSADQLKRYMEAVFDFDEHDIDIDLVNWSEIIRNLHFNNTSFEDGEDGDYGYDDDDHEQLYRDEDDIAGSIFQDKLDMYRKEY